MSEAPPPAGFDQFAGNYDQALQQGLSLSGEGKDFFAEGRVAWLRKRLGERGSRPKAVLDFGCGTGTSVPLLLGLPGAESAVGVDLSEASLEVARRAYQRLPARFVPLGQFAAEAEFDLAFCNGVFHHIPLDQRDEAVRRVWRSLRPGGYWAFWENNPWNPGTRWVMKRIPFDRDAILVCPGEARRRLRVGGFEVIGSDFLFYFPRSLAWLRWLEPAFVKLPFGAQYLVLARKP